MNMIPKITRIDYILIWGHGLVFEEEIIEIIRNCKFFKILYYIYYKPPKIDELIDAVYSYDYAPISHLKDKTKYLRKTPNEVLFIFFENLVPNEEFYGEKAFRHIESQTLKAFKENIRDVYNPYQYGQRTHDHIIHASDNEKQTHYILKYLGYKNGIYDIQKRNNIIDVPPFLNIANCTIKEIAIKNIIVSIAVGDRNKFIIEKVKIVESPQYKALNGDVSTYIQYIKSHRGGAIKMDHDIKKFMTMSNNFTYLDNVNHNTFIIVQKANMEYQLLDGLHRVSILKHQNIENVKVVVLN